jgi:hypothetical protein
VPYVKRAKKLFWVLDSCRAALEAGAIVIVEDEGYRLRHLPIHRGSA